ncbi:MAG: hypothetical protein LM523_11375, partial [Candidatus Contendobacter sp.]|nr:hypothetical protein [Candidatus Contendobacter sp.]
AGDATYNAAPQVTKTFTVKAKTNQSISAISFSPAALTVSGVTTASATATSGLPVSFRSTTPNICSVNGAVVTGIAAGSCTVAANQAGDATYNAAPQITKNITVTKINQTISVISFSSTTLIVGNTTTVSATATSGLLVSFRSTTPNICSVNGAVVTGIAAGSCTVAANQAGDATYNAAPQVTKTFTVKAKTNQSISAISFSPAALTVSGVTTASATATSGLPVSFRSTTPNICSVNGAVVTGIAAGSCTVAANQAGDATYNAAPQVTKNITVSN